MKTYADMLSIENRIAATAELIKATIPNPIKIVAIAKGGLIPAMYLLKELDIQDMFIVGVKSYEGEVQGIIQLYQDFDHTFSPDDNVIMVDDIAESGSTFHCVNSLLRRKGAQKIYSYAIYHKPVSDFVPSFHEFTAEKDSWIVFPWESNK